MPHSDRKWFRLLQLLLVGHVVVGLGDLASTLLPLSRDLGLGGLWARVPAPLNLATILGWGAWQLSIADRLASRRPLRFSPGLGYVAFFVPVVHLIVPYLAIRELAFPNGVAESRRHTWLVVWWVFFAVHLLTIYASMLGGEWMPDYVGPTLRILTAAAAVRVVSIVSEVAGGASVGMQAQASPQST